MHYLKSIEAIPEGFDETAVTIGSYDGIHLGHQKIIHKLYNYAKNHQLKSVVISFDPYPKEFFLGERVPRLMSWREKYLALEAFDIDYFLIIPFDKEFSAMSAENFVSDVLLKRLHMRYLIIGDDFRFGHKRLGDYQLLKTKATEKNFELKRADTYEYQAERISSSRIRHTLQAGNMQLVEYLLGHPYFILGRVVHGDKLGRELGFPTANISLERRLVALNGVYVVRVTGVGGKILYGAANVGTRPAVGGQKRLLEVYLFDFDKDIYGLEIKVEFLHKLRDETDFPTLDALKEKISADVQDAKAWLSR